MSSAALTLTRKYTLYETLFLRILNKLPIGQLELEMPDGNKLYFGQGGHPVRANIHIVNPSFFSKCALYGDIGFAEAYIDGDWQTSSITDVIAWFILNINHNPMLTGAGLKRYASNLFRFVNKLYHSTRKNTIDGSKRNISEHYDLGNDFYRLFLDKTMTYSSAIFQTPDQSLEDAQFEKYDRLCRYLQLKESDHVLEIGSGWGGFALHAARNYRCRVTTVTISEQQYNYAKALIEKEGLTSSITIQLQDYRKLEGLYDKIVSIEMLEAVGHEYLPSYFKKVDALLKPGGNIALQVITSRDKHYEKFRKDVDFIQKHIFPGSQTPSLSAIQQAVMKTSSLNLFDVKDIGLDYARTLRLWCDAFNLHLTEIKKLGMNEKFIRKWNYYLQYCEAAFAVRHITVLQLVYHKPNY